MDFSNISSPQEYAQAAFLAREVAKELFIRLEWMKISPQVIVDLGCGLGADLGLLQERYPQAQVLGFDLAQSFLQQAKKEGCPQPLVCADTHQLPLPSGTVDLIFANLLLPWSSDLEAQVKEWRRILKPKGLLLFSCLGPDTFKEWRESKKAAFIPGLMDMHDVGDLLLAKGLADPVLEVEDITLTYRSQKQLQAELELSGMQQTGISLDDLSFPTAVLPVSFEIIYGHAWCPIEKGFAANDQGVVKIPISQLKKAAP